MAAVIRRYSELLHSRIGVRGVIVDHRTALLLHDWGSIGEEKKRGTGQVNFLSFPQETCPRLSNSLVFLHRHHRAVEILGKRCAIAERVVSATEFRENADECMDWARTARSDRERAIFLQMADTWLQAATLASRRARPTKSPMDAVDSRPQ
jgi:hypothetical protein